MAKILITGIDGFTGRHLARRLIESGYDVCGVTHMSIHDLEWRVYTCNILDREKLMEVFALERPDAVVHLAAIAFIAHGDASAIYQTNVIGTRNVLESLARAGCEPRSVLLASSANIYGNTRREVIDESVPPEPSNDYAVSKIAMEYVARLWADQLPITVVRPFNYTGVGQSENFLLPKIVSHFRNRLPVLELGNLHIVRDFSDVRMNVDAYARLLEGQFSGETFNVCTGFGYSLGDVLTIMNELTGHHPHIRVNPKFVRAHEVHKLIGNNDKLLRAIGPLQSISLRDTLNWMLENP